MSTSWRLFFSWMLWKGFPVPWRGFSIIHHCCTLWTCRSFYVSELTSALFFFSMYQTVDLATPNVPAISLVHSFSKPNNLSVSCVWRAPLTAWCGSQQQLPNTNATLRVNSRPFTCLINVEIMKELVHTCQWNSVWVNCLINYGPLKTIWWTYPQIKSQSVHFNPIFII